VNLQFSSLTAVMSVSSSVWKLEFEHPLSVLGSRLCFRIASSFYCMLIGFV